jgi:hypothetical protein
VNVDDWGEWMMVMEMKRELRMKLRMMIIPR